MSSLANFETALADLLADRTTGDDDRYPITAYVVFAMTTDPETMVSENPEWVVPEGQRSYVTRGLIEAARDELSADNTASIAYVAEWDEDDDE